MLFSKQPIIVDTSLEISSDGAAAAFIESQFVSSGHDRTAKNKIPVFIPSFGIILIRRFGTDNRIAIYSIPWKLDGGSQSFGYQVSQVLIDSDQWLCGIPELFAITGVY